jgi:hypothetical protein
VLIAAVGVGVVVILTSTVVDDVDNVDWKRFGPRSPPEVEKWDLSVFLHDDFNGRGDGVLAHSTQDGWNNNRKTRHGEER